MDPSCGKCYVSDIRQATFQVGRNQSPEGTSKFPKITQQVPPLDSQASEWVFPLPGSPSPASLESGLLPNSKSAGISGVFRQDW